MSENKHLQASETLPAKETRCTDVLSDTLQGFAGIHRADFDLNQGKLNVAFDPRILSREQALQLIRTSGRQAAARVMQCRAKGPAACAACALEMGEELTRHYTHIASHPIPATGFRTSGQIGVIEVNLNQPSWNDIEVSEQFFPEREQEIEPAEQEAAGLPREKLEVLLTAINALTGVAAFLSTNMVGGMLPVFLWIMSYIAGGYYGLLDGIETLKEKKLDVNLLMILAALGAAVIGQPAEGAVLLFLFSLSNTLQSFAMDRSRKAIEKLLDLRPPVATVRRGSRVIELPVEQLVMGDVVLVRPGERFPIDGEVITGSSDVNQAPITGESMPVHKSTGDPVFAGTVNGNGALEIRVTRLAKDTTLARIVKMVEEAQGNKAQTQRMLDNFEQVYALIVLAGAALLITAPVLLFGQEFMPSFYRAMTFLVVASPCALVISTPASILSAIANGARNGILFKGGVHLEKASTLKVIAFDKTGTLTRGKPQVASIYPMNGLSEDELLRLVAGLEARSEHPLAAALVSAAQERSIELPAATEFRAIPGQGIEGHVENRLLWVGGQRLFIERGVQIPDELLKQVAAAEEAGQTVMIAYSPGKIYNDGASVYGGEWLGLIGAADILRDDAQVMIQALKKHGIERVVMLTGDNERVAARIARLAGVDEYYADLLPQDKVTMLEQLKAKYGPVAMVGDGVNDAPALATADVGIAMGGAGTDVAMETADLVLMSEDLQKLPHAIGLAHRARKIVWQNLTFALTVIVLLVISAFGAQLPLPLGVVGHEGSTVLVVLNGLRLLGYRG
ncbi:MAG: cadmium-translocating P-type ATPase [Chloroflexi bacterium]|nr:cadmium-translocating P-type ATPase [Chloroflexota bacterium]